MLLPPEVQQFVDRQNELRRRFGVPETVLPLHNLPLLRTFGIDHDKAVVYRYPSVEAANAFAALTRTLFGHTPYGPVETEVGVLLAIDYLVAYDRWRDEFRQLRPVW